VTLASRHPLAAASAADTQLEEGRGDELPRGPGEKLLSSEGESHGPGSRAGATGELSSGSRELVAAPASSREKRCRGGFFRCAASRENARAVFS